MKKMYRSPYEAYPYLSSKPTDFRCDFELMTDELASMTGLLRGICGQLELPEKDALVQELAKICELIYHVNPTTRTKLTVTDEEIQWLLTRVNEMDQLTRQENRPFVLPMGSISCSYAHVLRTKAKDIVRLLYRMDYAGQDIEPKLYDVVNLLSGYFFMLALYLNQLEGGAEVPFVSRNY
jgi:cob(I)alamin adenosyltransferase